MYMYTHTYTHTQTHTHTHTHTQAFYRTMDIWETVLSPTVPSDVAESLPKYEDWLEFTMWSTALFHTVVLYDAFRVQLVTLERAHKLQSSRGVPAYWIDDGESHERWLIDRIHRLMDLPPCSHEGLVREAMGIWPLTQSILETWHGLQPLFGGRVRPKSFEYNAARRRTRFLRWEIALDLRQAIIDVLQDREPSVPRTERREETAAAAARQQERCYALGRHVAMCRTHCTGITQKGIFCDSPGVCSPHLQQLFSGTPRQKMSMSCPILYRDRETHSLVELETLCNQHTQQRLHELGVCAYLTASPFTTPSLHACGGNQCLGVGGRGDNHRYLGSPNFSRPTPLHPISPLSWQFYHELDELQEYMRTASRSKAEESRLAGWTTYIPHPLCIFFEFMRWASLYLDWYDH
jgi:hypothetical protein